MAMMVLAQLFELYDVLAAVLAPTEMAIETEFSAPAPGS